MFNYKNMCGNALDIFHNSIIVYTSYYIFHILYIIKFVCYSDIQLCSVKFSELVAHLLCLVYTAKTMTKQSCGTYIWWEGIWRFNLWSMSYFVHESCYQVHFFVDFGVDHHLILLCQSKPNILCFPLFAFHKICQNFISPIFFFFVD